MVESSEATASVITSGKRIAGWRISALLEIIAFLGLALALDWYFFAGDRFFNLQPHPFWIIVLLVAAQYGTSEALLAAIASTAALLAWNLPPQRIEQDLYAYLLTLAYNPLLWLVTVIFIGAIGSRHRARIRTLEHELTETRQREAVVDEAYRRVAAAKSQLEVRVAGQMKTVVDLYQAAKAIDRMQPGEVMLGVYKIVRAILDPKQHSLYLLQGQALEVTVADDWPEDAEYSRRFNAGEPLFRAVIGERRILCAARPEDLPILGGEGVIAGPLLAPDTGEIFGMLKIEEINFLDFNLSSLENFRITCEWIATAYAQALRYERIETTRAYSDQKNLFAAGFRDRQVSIITLLARRIGFDVSALQVRIEGIEHLPQDKLAQVSAAAGDAVRKVLRDTDLAFDHPRSGWEFEVLLPATPLENANVAAEKLRQELDGLLRLEHPLLRIVITTTSLYRAHLVGVVP